MKTIFTNVFRKTVCIVVVLFLLPFQFIQAQNWEPVYFSETAKFDVDEQDNGVYLYLYPFSTDGDTITGRFLPNLNDEASCNSGIETGCVTSNFCKVAISSFLQEYAVFMPGGVVEFQNPDTFQIHSLAQFGESWIFKTDEIGNPVMAEVTDQYSGTVLGQNDSIKVVSVADGTTFHLSKQHGITFWSDADVNFELSSIPARNLGGSNLSNASVFDFSVGDVFVHLNKGETGSNEGFPNNYENGKQSLIRNDVMEVTESQGTLFITMQTSSYTLNYSNWNGNYTEEGLADSNISIMEIPLTEDCHLYKWPIGGPTPSRIPAQVQNLYNSYGFSTLSCNGSEEPVECTESELLGGTSATSNFTSVATGNYGNHALLNPSMAIFNTLDAESSPLEVLYIDPRSFYSWETLARCDYQSLEYPSQIAVGETLHANALDNQFLWFTTQIYSLGEGLGIVAYDQEILGLGSWCMDRTIMIGYQKAGEEPFGFIPESLDLLSLSTGDNNKASSLNVFPNPASTTVRLDMPGVVLSHATIHDMQGRQLLDVRLQHNEPTVDVSDLPRGIYLLRTVSKSGEMYVKKLVVE
jgi:hypothetical protein